MLTSRPCNVTSHFTRYTSHGCTVGACDDVMRSRWRPEERPGTAAAEPLTQHTSAVLLLLALCAVTGTATSRTAGEGDMNSRMRLGHPWHQVGGTPLMLHTPADTDATRPGAERRHVSRRDVLADFRAAVVFPPQSQVVTGKLSPQLVDRQRRAQMVTGTGTVANSSALCTGLADTLNSTECYKVAPVFARLLVLACMHCRPMHVFARHRRCYTPCPA